MPSPLPSFAVPIVIGAILLLGAFLLFCLNISPYTFYARGDGSKSLSWVPLLEIVPILVASFIAWCADVDGVLSASSILRWGLLTVGLSYLHFFSALMALGWLYSRKHHPKD